ncbi:MAG TPA: NAD(P)-dependent oxidoreductase [Thermoleophilia bacterium]|nr:NAD(P)-dependent oxidoreductase [Thermoleophilia bacterium]
MKIALIGATGYVGSHIRDEALSRNHEVTAIVRHPEKLPVRANLAPRQADVLDVDSLAKVLAGHDAVISAFSAERDSPDKYADHVAGAKAIIAATKQAGVKRLLVVGGAGSLEIAPGQQMIDQPDFPAEWKAGAGGTREFLYLLKNEPDLDWTFLSPAAMFEPGERTGKFRLGGDQLLVDEKGECRISLPDYAVAMIDELEQPQHIRKRFCVAY